MHFRYDFGVYAGINYYTGRYYKDRSTWRSIFSAYPHKIRLVFKYVYHHKIIWYKRMSKKYLSLGRLLTPSHRKSCKFVFRYIESGIVVGCNP